MNRLFFFIALIISGLILLVCQPYQAKSQSLGVITAQPITSSRSDSAVKVNSPDLRASTFKSRNGKTMPYRLLVPAGYDKKKKYPIVLWLHGGGGRGTDNLKQISDGNNYGFQAFADSGHQSKFPSFVLAPQCPERELWTTLGERVKPSEQLEIVMELFQDLQKKYSFDRERIYVAGQSMGGYGTWALISEYPEMFAAAVPVCGGGNLMKVSKIASVPVWAFHGRLDRSVKVELSRQMIAAIKKAGGNPRYTEFEQEGHVIWEKVFKDPAVLQWIFLQRKK